MNAETTKPVNDEASLKAQRGVRRTTLVLLIIIFLLFIWYLVSDRFTPYTASARLKTYVVKIVPDVSGYVAEVPINKNQMLEPGNTLLQIETVRFENAIKVAEAELELAGQEVGARTATIATATANVTAARTKLEEAQVQGARLFALEEKGVVAKAEADKARAEIESRRANLAAAEAELEKAKQQLGDVEADNNPRVRRAVAELEKARLNLARTTLTAPSRGYVGGLKIDEGAYITAGQPAMTFVSVDDIWIEAYMTENNLGRVGIGDKVELVFDAYPGQIFEGKVKSLPIGVSTGKSESFGDLPGVEKSRSWLRDPQRFPVVIQTTNYDYQIVQEQKGGVRLNSQADVIIYTDDAFLSKVLGQLWIRLVSLFSYAY